MAYAPQSRGRGNVYGSTDSLRSDASLRGRATAPAGFASSTDHWNSPPQPQHHDQDQDQLPVPPPAPVPFYKKRWFIISQIILIPIGIALIFILLWPVVRAIIESILKKTVLDIQSAVITSPGNDTYNLRLEGLVYRTGVIPAKITFTEPTNISWIEAEDTETPLGYMQLGELSAKHKRATINDTTVFHITDEAAFGRFSAALITNNNFTWRLVSYNLRVQAAKFPVQTKLTFDKLVTIKGFDNFESKVTLLDLQLPSDNPEGGINFVASTQLNNPSPFTIDLGTVVFELSYKTTILGIGAGTETKIAPGNNTISLKGTLKPQSNPDDIAAVSELFTRYLNGESSPVIATGLSTLQQDNSAISWLSQGLQALKLEVPFKSFVPIDPIKTITIGDLALRFDEENSWSPAAESNSVQATLQLPFGFGLSIDQIQNEFMIVQDGNNVTGLSTPLGASKSSVSVLSSDNTVGLINITIADTRLSCPEPQHAAFASFNRDLTNSEETTFHLVGKARAIANMSIGVITLDPIKVNVPTSLKGLQGLKGRTTIESVDVIGGTADHITLDIGVSIDNPSSLNLATGDLVLQLARENIILGTALLPNLTLGMGNNTLVATSNFEANKSPQGLQTLNDFVGKKDVALKIAGYEGSTKVASLLEAFDSLDLDVVLPSLKTNLVKSAALQVLSSTGKESNIAHVTVSLENPFSAGLEITKISSTVTAFGISLGTIEQEVSFKASGKSTTESPDLNLDMNFEPASLFTVTRLLARQAGLNTAPLDRIVELGGYSYVDASSAESARSDFTKRQADLFKGFDLTEFVGAAFKQLKSDVNLKTELKIGDYATVLEFSQEAVPTATDDTLNFILPVLAEPIVQKIVSGSTLSIETVLIVDPQLNSFRTRLKGSIGNAGPFDATIAFPEGLTVAWQGRPIGKIAMDDVKVVGDVGASFEVESVFEVADVGYLGEFTKTLLTSESFDWEISGVGLTVDALGISVSGIELSTRVVTLKGFNGLRDAVKIETFDLPSNDPAGGIHLTVQATTANPSQVGIQLSSIGFQAYADNVMISPLRSAGAITLAPLSTSPLSLVGRLVPQSSSAGLATVSNVFNNFVHGKDSNVVVHGESAGPSSVTWLNEGIKVLQIATVLPNRGPQNIIQSIALNDLSLMFSAQTAYSPISGSKATEAKFDLPFAFPLDIKALQQTITLAYQGSNFGELAIPKGPSNTDVSRRLIHITFDGVPLKVFSGSHDTFDRFVAATTVGTKETLRLVGSANADALTAVGLLSLTDIAFSVETDIAGLQGLGARPVTVANLDVNHGFPDHLLINVDSGILNPSNLTIGTGDVSFSLINNDQRIGSVEMNDLVLTPGSKDYPTAVHYSPQGGAVSAGRALLQNFLQGINTSTTIAGTRDSTPIDSLKQALSQIHLFPVVIPALQQNLIKSASLKFPTNIVSTGVASTSFILENPFTASINLVKVGAVATYHGLRLGRIPDIDLSANPLRAPGHSSVTSPFMPLEFNLDPPTIIRLLLLTSQANGVNLGPLIQLFQFVLENPDYKPPVKTSVDPTRPTCVSGQQFDVAGAILKSLAGLEVDLAVDSGVRLDDYPTDLAFDQHLVPAITDETALYLIGAVAGPVAQHLVDGSVLAFEEADISNISNEGFDLSLKGSLTNIGPLDATITFTEPVTVTWQGKNIASIELPPICASANTGVPEYNTKARLSITDTAAFTDFAVFLLHNPSFEWTIHTPKLRVTALGTIFDDVSLSKVVSFSAFNGLPGVAIENFQLPSDDPAGGIHIETGARIPSPAQIGIDLGRVSFQTFYDGVNVGPLDAENLVLKANAVTETHLSGRITPKSGNDLEIMGELFSEFLQGKNLTLQTVGDSVHPPGSSGPVGWLSTAFKTLTIDVILPGERYKVIEAIELKDLAVEMKTQAQAFAPLTDSETTIAKYRNPFGFSLQVVQTGQTIVLGSHGVQMAQLVLPLGPSEGGVSTGNLVDLHIHWNDVQLQSINHAAFAQLFAGVTLRPDVEIELTGAANVVAKTPIGDVAISSIPIDVVSHLKGINSFGGTAGLTDVKVTGSGGAGGSEYIISPLKTTLENPSNVSLDTVDISLPVIYHDTVIGRAVVSEFDLVPGENVISTEFRYQPDNANDTTAQAFLTEFITSDHNVPLTIDGDSESSPFASLGPALDNLRLQTAVQAMNQPKIITHINVWISLETLVTDLVEVEFELYNPLDSDLVIEFVQSDASIEGEVYAIFSQPFENFVVPPGGTASSGRFPNVRLVKGAIPSLDIIPLGYLDIATGNTARVGQGGYQAPFLHINQDRVPTTYTLDLGFAAMRKAALDISASRSASDVSASATSVIPSATQTNDDVPPSSAAAPSVESTIAPIEPTATSTNNGPASVSGL